MVSRAAGSLTCVAACVSGAGGGSDEGASTFLSAPVEVTGLFLWSADMSLSGGEPAVVPPEEASSSAFRVGSGWGTVPFIRVP